MNDKKKVRIIYSIKKDGPITTKKLNELDLVEYYRKSENGSEGTSTKQTSKVQINSIEFCECRNVTNIQNSPQDWRPTSLTKFNFLALFAN